MPTEKRSVLWTTTPTLIPTAPYNQVAVGGLEAAAKATSTETPMACGQPAVLPGTCIRASQSHAGETQLANLLVNLCVERYKHYEHNCNLYARDFTVTSGFRMMNI